MPKKGSTYKRRNPMRKRLVEAMLAGSTVPEARKIAGYTHDNSAYKALSVMRQRGEMMEELDKLGWKPADFARKHLAKMLEAKKTIFFASNGIVTDKRVVENTEAQQNAANMYCKIRGLYAPIEIEHGGVIAHEIVLSERKEAMESIAKIQALESNNKHALLAEVVED